MCIEGEKKTTSGRRGCRTSKILNESLGKGGERLLPISATVRDSLGGISTEELLQKLKASTHRMELGGKRKVVRTLPTARKKVKFGTPS